MRRLLLFTFMFLLTLGVAGVTFAANTSNKLSDQPPKTDMGDRATSPRTGGDTIATATVIPTPLGPSGYTDTGATCGYNDDYNEVCPYLIGGSPDVVYSYTPTNNNPITVDLCASLYDTKLFIYAGSVGNLVGCNDDAGCGYSGYQSKLENIPVTAGVTYYIVVDGYDGACGTYGLLVTESVPIQVVCPAGSPHEGEPPCGDNYYDTYNGGCNTSGWTYIQEGSGDGCAYMCGKSGTYMYNGASYRDTDWYIILGTGQTVTFECTAVFPLQMIFIWGPNCANLQYDYLQVAAGVTGTLTHSVAADTENWLWVGPSVFTGVPCESDYVMHVCGIFVIGPVPTESTSWGQIKHLYK
jgi:hypothetical protein